MNMHAIGISGLAPAAKGVPSDIEAEKALLGSLLVQPQAYEEVEGLVSEEDFIDPRHAVIFRAIQKLTTAGCRQFDAVVVAATASDFKGSGFKSDKERAEYIEKLFLFVPHSMYVREYANAIRNKALRRRLIDRARRVIDIAAEPNEITEAQLVGEFRAEIESIESALNLGKSEKNGALDSVLQIWTNGLPSGAALGFPQLDEAIRAQDGDYVVVAAETSQGKSAFACCAAVNVARSEARKERSRGVLYVSLEMSDVQIWRRMSAAMSRVDQGNAGVLREDEAERIKRAILDLKSMKLDVVYRPGADVRTLTVIARKYAREWGGLEMLVVDYLQLISTEGEGESFVVGLSNVSHKLKTLAGSLQCKVLCLSQLNRNVNVRETRVPRLADLRGSGAIEQDADTVIFLYHDPKDPADIMQLIVGKSRNGYLTSVRSRFDRPLSLYEAIEPDVF